MALQAKKEQGQFREPGERQEAKTREQTGRDWGADRTRKQSPGGRQGLGLSGGSLHLPKKGGSSYFSETTSWVLLSLHTPHLVISNSTDR